MVFLQGLIGFPAGLASATILVSIPTAGIAVPVAFLTSVTVSYALFELINSNRDVRLAQEEIDFLNEILKPEDVETVKEFQEQNKALKNQAYEFFTSKINLDAYSKKNILSLILKHEDVNTILGLLRAYIGNPKLGKNQTTLLAKRFWKQEGFLACRLDTGTLAEI